MREAVVCFQCHENQHHSPFLQYPQPLCVLSVGTGRSADRQLDTPRLALRELPHTVSFSFSCELVRGPRLECPSGIQRRISMSPDSLRRDARGDTSRRIRAFAVGRTVCGCAIFVPTYTSYPAVFPSDGHACDRAPAPSCSSAPRSSTRGDTCASRRGGSLRDVERVG